MRIVQAPATSFTYERQVMWAQPQMSGEHHMTSLGIGADIDGGGQRTESARTICERGLKPSMLWGGRGHQKKG